MKKIVKFENCGKRILVQNYRKKKNDLKSWNIEEIYESIEGKFK